MTDLATLRRLRTEMILLAADAYELGNRLLAAQAMRAADNLQVNIERICAHG